MRNMKITQQVFSEHIGVSAQAVSKMVKTGIIDLSEGLDASRLRYVEHLREQAAGRLSKGRYDLTSERARLAHNQANEKELQVQILEGDLIPSSEVVTMLETVISNARAKLLNLPTRAAQAALNCTDLNQIEREIQTLVYESLSELSQTYDDPEAAH